MIPTPAATLTLMNGSRFRTHWRLLVEDAAGVMQDYSNFGGFDWRDGVGWGKNLDNPIATGSIKLRKSINGISIMPLVDGSVLNTGGPALDHNRRVQTLVQVTQPLVAADSAAWQLIFDGLVQKVQTSSESTVDVAIMDRSVLLNRIIRDQITYGSAEGVPVQTVAQQIIDNTLGAGVFTLQTEGTIAFVIREYTPFEVTVRDALNALTAPFAGYIDYKWVASLVRDELVMVAPNRSVITPVASLGMQHYKKVDEASIDAAGRRNRVWVRFRDRSTGEIITAEAYNQASIDAYNEQFMRVTENETSAIDTLVEAQDMADLILSDLLTPPVQQKITNWFWYPVQLNDYLEFLANPRIYDSNILSAIYGVKHELSGTKKETTFEGGGQPKGGYKRWQWIGRDQITVLEVPKASIQLLELLAGEDESTTVRFQLTATGPEGVMLRYKVGPGGVWVDHATTSHTLVVNRAAGSTEPVELLARAVMPDGRFDEAGPVVKDWNTEPSIKSPNAPEPWLDTTIQEQQGWILRRAADDDTNGIRVEVSGGVGAVSCVEQVIEVVSAGVYWLNATSQKTFTLHVIQDAGQRGTVTCTPYRNSTSGDQGTAGRPLPQQLERAPLTLISWVKSEQTQLVTLQVKPPSAIIRHRRQFDVPVAWTETPGPRAVVTVDVSGGEAVLEYYGYMQDGPIEEVRRQRFNSDPAPSFEAITLDEAAGANLLTANIVNPDNDVTSYSIWARLGGSPFIVSEGVATSTPDDQYLKATGKFGDGHKKTWYAPNGYYQAVARVYGKDGRYDQKILKDPPFTNNQFQVQGVAQALAELSTLQVTRNLSTHVIEWAHNVAAGTGHYVAIREVVNGVSRDVLTLAQQRPPTYEAGTTADTVASAGGFVVNISTGTTFKHFDYYVTLYDVNGNFVSEKVVSIEGSVYAEDPGEGKPTVAPTDLVFLVVGTTFTAAWTNTDDSFPIELAFEILDNGTWAHHANQPVGQGVDDYSQSNLYAAGETGRFWARYYNSMGAGPWSSVSNTVTG